MQVHGERYLIARDDHADVVRCLARTAPPPARGCLPGFQPIMFLRGVVELAVETRVLAPPKAAKDIFNTTPNF